MRTESLKTRGLHTSVRFAPRANLDKEHKQRFQAKCNEGFDWRRQEYAQNAWQLLSPQAEGDPRSQMKFTVQPDAVSFEDYFPTGPLDLYLDNLKLALDCVANVFSPRAMVGSAAAVRLTAQADGDDARLYIGQRCLKLDEHLVALGRPVHAVGLRLLMPPLAGEGKPNWQVEMKVESLVEDVRQLYIEVDARWANPIDWSPQAVADRVKTTHEFAVTHVVSFLRSLGSLPPTTL